MAVGTNLRAATGVLVLEEQMIQLQPARRRFATVLLIGLAVVVSARAAGARSYSLDEVVVHARVDPDGSLRIDETRTYTYDGRYSWAEFRLPLDRVGRVSDFSLTEGGRAFTPGTDEAPGTYRLASSDDELHVRWHYVAEDETRSFRLRYRVGDAVDLHADVAELYYQFVGVINPQAIGRVAVELELPRPAVFDEVRAWAHGPLHGGVDFRDTGRLSFDVAPLPARQKWEARVTFPVDWMAAAGASAVAGDPALDRIRAEEDAWAREANARRERALAAAEERAASDRTAGRMAGVLAVLGLLAVLAGHLKVGRAHRVDYDLRIDSTLPDEAPAVASYLYHGKQVSGAALGATLFDLARRGFVRMEPDSQPKKWYESGAPFTMRLDRRAWRGRSDDIQPYERSLVEFLFDEVAEGRDTLHSRQVEKAQGKMQKWFEAWKSMVRAAAGDAPYYDPPSTRAAVAAGVVAAAVLAAGIAVIVTVGRMGVVAVLAGVVCLALSLTILRLTPEAKLRQKKFEALRRYLKTYHERPGDGVGGQIGEYLVYGLALGVGTRPIGGLFDSLSEQDRAAYLPWYVYADGAASPAEFAQSMTSMVSAATAAVSSSAGAGGGASAGGGVAAAGVAAVRVNSVFVPENRKHCGRPSRLTGPTKRGVRHQVQPRFRF